MCYHSLGKLQLLPQKQAEENAGFEPRMMSNDCLRVSVGMTKIFTIFCVEPLVSVYRFRRSLTSISLM